MQIQPIKPYMVNNNCKPRCEKWDVSYKEPNFRGFKGFLTGGAIGSGLTAAGVALIAGTAALPAFLGYIVINGALAAYSGHMIQNEVNKKDE